ncbi:MAG TPA: SUF system Fe-S cluster assembly regulator [Methylococcaceae bacterium]|jgi:FeS assembly SUF system regulator|nr:SUF system Fe-S cluster assembly regulator [Methylococcaceae bacterium]HIL39478.1 SUF system Fe-S cluster assembly regulator [Methylococcales bacterium]
MLRLSKLTDYATVLLTYMAKTNGQLHTAMELSEVTAIHLPTVSKVLKVLSKEGLVYAIRGSKGGYQLAQAPESITVARVIGALEGPVAITQCSSPTHHCEQALACEIKGNWGVINRAIVDVLESITLADMMVPQTHSPKEIQVSMQGLNR